jgi:hypothetical protein
MALFSFALIPLTANAAALLSIDRQGGNAVITWTNLGTLEEADEVTGPWSSIDGATSPYSVSLGANLIAALDYSDTYTVGTSIRPGTGYYLPGDGVDAYYNIETVYGGLPAVQWHQTGKFSFGQDLSEPINPGTGSGTTGGGSANIAYGQRDDYIVQADFRGDDGGGGAGGDPLVIGSVSSNTNNYYNFPHDSLYVEFHGDSISLWNYDTGRTFLPGVAGVPLSGWVNLAVRFNRVENALSIYVNRILVETVDLTTFLGGAYQFYSNAAVGIGGGFLTHMDNFQVGAPSAVRKFYRLKLDTVQVGAPNN